LRTAIAFFAAALAGLAAPSAAAADATHAPRSAREAAAAAARAHGGKPDTHREDGSPQPKSGGDDLTTCKRDADGMRGPERSRFMTECLRERN
jgi:hypothetical protein